MKVITDEFVGIGLEYNGEYWGDYGKGSRESPRWYWSSIHDARLFHPNKFKRHIDLSIFNDFKDHPELSKGKLVKISRTITYVVQDFQLDQSK